MTYYRQKLLLNLIIAFGGKLNSTNLQKLLFLFTIKQAKKTYEYVINFVNRGIDPELKDLCKIENYLIEV